MDFSPYIQLFEQIIKDWWWLLLPAVLLKPVIFFWLWWRTEIFLSQQRSILLEFTVPKEVTQPIKAMENVFAGLWQIHDPANTREKWLEGKVQLSLSIEIVSDGGDIHLYFRIPEGNRKLVESAIYSQYPEVEINVVEDYTKNVPPDIPNKDWDLWGVNYKLQKHDVYPIKTYQQFFEERTDVKEEKRIDPLALLLEGLSALNKGEKLWIQIIISPVLVTQRDYVAEGKKVVDKLIKRPDPKKPPTLLGDIEAVGTHLATGSPKSGAADTEVREFIPPEMKLTPGERDIVSAIEQKIGKYVFHVIPRFIYLAPRDDYYGPSKAIAMSYFTQLSTANYNGFGPLRPTLTKVHTILTWFLDKRRVFIRKRRLFRHYTKRLAPFFPNSEKGLILLNIEELATMFHFPGHTVAPVSGLSRVETTKREAPSSLPVEED